MFVFYMMQKWYILIQIFFFINSSLVLSYVGFCYALIGFFLVFVYIILVIFLRYYLFIWSVFFLKFFYEGMYLFITVVVCVFFIVMDQINIKFQIVLLRFWKNNIFEVYYLFYRFICKSIFKKKDVNFIRLMNSFNFFDYCI